MGQEVFPSLSLHTHTPSKGHLSSRPPHPSGAKENSLAFLRHFAHLWGTDLLQKLQPSEYWSPHGPVPQHINTSTYLGGSCWAHNEQQPVPPRVGCSVGSLSGWVLCRDAELPSALMAFFAVPSPRLSVPPCSPGRLISSRCPAQGGPCHREALAQHNH